MSAVKSLWLLIAAISVIILVQAPPILNQPPIQGTALPIFYRLPLQWPNSFCRDYIRVSCVQPVPQEFTIHGLWPYDQHGNMIICSAGPGLKKSDVNQIVGLHENWPSHVGGVSDFAFWRQQWLKHGRCIGLTPREYFQKALDLKKQIDVQIGGSLVRFFRAKGLPPDEKNRYDPHSFLGEIESKTRYVAEIHCNMNKAGDYQLYEIRFCFSNNWQLSNCGIHIQPANSSNIQGAKTYQKKKGPNSQKISPPPPPPPFSPPTFDIGNCYGNGRILFPTLVPASPPPPARPRRSPPPPPKSSHLKRKQWPPPPPPPNSTLLKAPPTPPLSPDIVITYADILVRRTHLEPPPPPSKLPRLKRKQRPPPPHPPPASTLLKAPPTPPLSPDIVITYADISVRRTHLEPPPPPPSKSPRLKRKQRPPPPPPPATPTLLKAPPTPPLSPDIVITYADILVRRTHLEPPPPPASKSPRLKRKQRSPPPPLPPTPTLLKAPPTPPLSPEIVITYAEIVVGGTHLAAPPPPPSKSPRLKRKQRPPPPPPPPTPTLLKAPPTPPLSPEVVITYAEIVVRGTHLQPPPPPPPKSPQPKRKQWPPSPPTPRRLKAPSPPHLPSYTAITCDQTLVRGTCLQPPPASASASASPPHAKRGRGWKHFMKLILTLHNFLIHLGILGALRKLRGGR